MFRLSSRLWVLVIVRLCIIDGVFSLILRLMCGMFCVFMML